MAINTDRLATGIIAIMHMIKRYEQKIEHHNFCIKNRIDLGIGHGELSDELAADTFNLESLQAVHLAAREKLYELTSSTEISVPE